MENIGKPCVEQKKNSVELSDIEIWVQPLFYCHFPSLTYFYIWYITDVDMQRGGIMAVKAFDTRQIKWAITIA